MFRDIRSNYFLHIRPKNRLMYMIKNIGGVTNGTPYSSVENTILRRRFLNSSGSS